MKRFSLLLAAGLMVFSLTACGNNDVQEDNTSETSEVVEGTDETLDDTVEDTTEDTTEATDVSENTEESSVAEEEIPEEITWSDEMQSYKDAVVGVLDTNYFPEMMVPADLMEVNYGVTADMYDDYFGEVPMMATNIDTLLIVKAKDGKVEDVQNALNAYRDTMLEDTMQYPMNLSKIQGSKIETIDNYVILAMLGGDNMEAMEEGDEAAIKHSQEQNDKAIEAIRQLIQQ